MLIDRILFPILSLGPGKRLVIWTVGCSKNCSQCSNKELWNFDKEKDIAIDELITLIEKHINMCNIDGVTITGGDPLEQCEELIKLVKFFRLYTDDILVYTGYTIEEIQVLFTKKQYEEIKKNISVLIDGRYKSALNDNLSALRGSTNQRIHMFNSSLKPRYDNYIQNGRKIQNVFSNGKIVSVGIHNKEEENDE